VARGGEGVVPGSRSGVIGLFGAGYFLMDAGRAHILQRMQDLKTPGHLILTCARGTAPLLLEELRGLGYAGSPVEETAVATRGTLEDAMRLNLHLRTAQRILLRLGTWAARTPDDLYRALVAEPWDGLLFPDGYLSITTAVENSHIQDPRFAGLKCKDAIVDRMVQACGRRPDSGGERSGVVLHLRWVNDQAEVFLDTAGEPLSRRSYRRVPLQAPMQETLAASCVLATPWRGESAFVNPMCGSGTLAIEAALVALGRAPGSLRRNFGFMHVRGYREETWKELKRASAAAEHARPAGRIVATDISEQAIEAARQNARNAGVEEHIEFSVCDYAATPLPPAPGVILFNPEYGERMGEERSLEPVYRGIGDFLKQKAQGYLGYVFTCNLKLAKCIRLHSKRRVILYNANLEGRLIEFELYAGTRDPGDGPRLQDG
jgi:putative N6-adenine-specific DNA methylase